MTPSGATVNENVTPTRPRDRHVPPSDATATDDAGTTASAAGHRMPPGPRAEGVDDTGPHRTSTTPRCSETGSGATGLLGVLAASIIPSIRAALVDVLRVIHAQ